MLTNMDSVHLVHGAYNGWQRRTEKEFATLLSGEGLELVKVWPGKTRYQAVVEVRLR